jgi:hypothetical protein
MKSAKSAAPAPTEPTRRVIPFRDPHGRRGEELAFLPAALEIVETPPSPIGRTIAATIILLFCAALVWAWWGTIDIVASAAGKIVPSGRTKVVQPFETGLVRSIRVEDGQAVKACDVLIELDPTANAADRDHLHNDLIAERLNIARLRAALAGGNDPVADFTSPDGADPGLVATQHQLLLNQVTEHRAKIAALARQQAQKEAEQSTTAATIHKLETLIPLIQPRVVARRSWTSSSARPSPISRPSSFSSSNRRNSASRRAVCAKRRRPPPRSARRAAKWRRNSNTRFPTSSPRRRRCVRAPTLVQLGPPAAINATLYDKLNFNVIRDIAPVAAIARAPNVMEVSLSVPVKTVPEFIAYAKANPGKLNMAWSGIGSSPHVSRELFKMMTGVNMLHVPYRGSVAALTDMLAGQVQVVFDNLRASLEYIKAGKVRALAVTTARRAEALPDLPTVGELVPGYEASLWFWDWCAQEHARRNHRQAQ